MASDIYNIIYYYQNNEVDIYVRYYVYTLYDIIFYLRTRIHTYMLNAEAKRALVLQSLAGACASIPVLRRADSSCALVIALGKY